LLRNQIVSLRAAWLRGSYALRKSSISAHATDTHDSDRRVADVALLLVQLCSSDAQSAWERFLLGYGAVLYQAVRASTRDEEEAADCFVFVCEKLAENGYRRLLRFKPQGAASFVTWLRVVTRNLCLDWQRKVHGRPRPFKFLQKLSALDLEIYRCRHERCLSVDDTLRHIRATWPNVTPEALNEIESRIARLLSPRQLWILSTRLASNTAVPLDVDGDERGFLEIADPMPSPELTIFNEQEQRWLRRCVDSLPSDERLIVQLRFEDELSLQEIAQLTGLGDAQRAQRKLIATLKKLRDAMEGIEGRKKSERVREMNQETK
jgi:RNA polymerase sigma factor (sigma-70 family)